MVAATAGIVGAEAAIGAQGNKMKTTLLRWYFNDLKSGQGEQILKFSCKFFSGFCIFVQKVTVCGINCIFLCADNFFLPNIFKSFKS